MPDVDVAQVEADLKDTLDAEEALYGYAMTLSPLVGAVALAGASLTIVKTLSAVWWVQLIIIMTIAAGGAWIFWRFWRIFRWLGEIRRADRLRRAIRAEQDRLNQLELAEQAVEEAKKHTYQSTMAVYAIQIDGVRDVKTLCISKNDFLVLNIDGDLTMEQVQYAAELIKQKMGDTIQPAAIITLGEGFGVSSLSRKELQAILDRSEHDG